jgi:hypothetical protein
MNLELFTHEISNAVKSHGLYEEVAVKTASEEQCIVVENENPKIAHVVTDAIRTEARTHKHTGVAGVTSFVTKMAAFKREEPLTNVEQLKIATALTVDDALTQSLYNDGMSDSARIKLASMRTYGREVFMEILRGVL